MTVGSNFIRSGSLKHICAAGPGGGMNKFRTKKLRSEARAAQTAANAKQGKARAMLGRSLLKLGFGFYSNLRSS